MQVYCFHLMPWAHLPEDFSQTHDSAWVTCPNSLYDPELGHPGWCETVGRMASRSFASDLRGPHVGSPLRLPAHKSYSTVTDLARLRGWSTSVPRASAVW